MNGRLNKADEWINDMKDRMMKTTQSEQHIESQMKKVKAI